MGLTKWLRHSKWVTRSPRWPALRFMALRRDGWRCVECGKAGRLEVDHVKPVRTNPELAFALSNLQSLCKAHHTAKTRIECGHPAKTPERTAWLQAVRELSKPEATKETEKCWTP